MHSTLNILILIKLPALLTEMVAHKIGEEMSILNELIPRSNDEEHFQFFRIMQLKNTTYN